MRAEEGFDEATTAARHNELRDIHHRIDALKEENERQYSSLTEKLHALEVAVIRGNRFPAAVWVSAAAIVLSVFGTGSALYAKLETTYVIAKQAVDGIEQHITDMLPAQNLVWMLDERVKGLEGRIVGMGPNGWHKSDHDNYAKMIEAQHQIMTQRLVRLEDAQAILCERVKNCRK